MIKMFHPFTQSFIHCWWRKLWRSVFYTWSDNFDKTFLTAHTSRELSYTFNTIETWSFHSFVPYSSIWTPQNTKVAIIMANHFYRIVAKFYLGLIACTLLLLMACILCHNRWLQHTIKMFHSFIHLLLQSTAQTWSASCNHSSHVSGGSCALC